jgi:hypothetical protein
MKNQRYFGLVIPAAALILVAGQVVRAEFSDDSSTAPPAAVTASPTPSGDAGEGEQEATATPTPEPTTAALKPKKEQTTTPKATTTPAATATPARRTTTALTDQIPDCEDLLSGAEEQLRNQMSSSHNGRGADAVTLGCSTKAASISVTVTRFSDAEDAGRADGMLKRAGPFNLKDRTLDLDSISADVVGGMIAPDDLGGLVTVGFRKGKITVSIAAQPTSYGKHVEDEAVTLAAKLAEALE